MPPEEIVALAPAAEPSYTPPANEPQGLEPKVESAEAKQPVGTETKVKLPASIKIPEKNGRFQARISDLVSQRDTVERENAQLRDRLSRAGMVRAEKTTPTPASAAGPTELNPDDFPSYGDYITALVNHTLEQRTESEKSTKAKADYEEYKKGRMSSFGEHAAPLATEYGDGFWDAITDKDLPISEAMADAVLELDEMGPFTMLWLAAHKDEAGKIAKMNPRAATVAIGRLAAQLDFEIKQGGGDAVETGGDTTTPSKPAPTPVPTPRGSAPTTLDNSPTDKDSVDEWLRKETDRLRRQNPNMRFYGSR